MSAPAFVAPVVALRGPADPAAPLVVLLHGRGSHEREIVALADHLPPVAQYAAVRAPIAEGGGFAWFANRGIGRPVAESLTATMAWFRTWLERLPAGSVVLAGAMTDAVPLGDTEVRAEIDGLPALVLPGA